MSDVLDSYADIADIVAITGRCEFGFIREAINYAASVRTRAALTSDTRHSRDGECSYAKQKTHPADWSAMAL